MTQVELIEFIGWSTTDTFRQTPKRDAVLSQPPLHVVLISLDRGAANRSINTSTP